jgi:hypothetical protein
MNRALQRVRVLWKNYKVRNTHYIIDWPRKEKDYLNKSHTPHIRCPILIRWGAYKSSSGNEFASGQRLKTGSGRRRTPFRIKNEDNNSHDNRRAQIIQFAKGEKGR